MKKLGGVVWLGLVALVACSAPVIEEERQATGSSMSRACTPCADGVDVTFQPIPVSACGVEVCSAGGVVRVCDDGHWNDTGRTCPGAPAKDGPTGLAWSFAGPIAGKHCIPIAEPSDRHTWDDNFLCMDVDVGLRWSNAGPIAGMHCVEISEPSDPDTWWDNYLCSPRDFGLAWSFAGPLANRSCVQIVEPSDPDFWHDNYLCQ